MLARMAPPFTTTVYTDPQFDPDARAKPDKANWRFSADFRNLLSTEKVGAWSDNRFRQVEHFRSVPYIAIRAVMDLVGGASYELLRRNRKPKGKVTFGPNATVAKSHAHGQQQGRDEDYTPFEDYDHHLAKLVRKPNRNESMGEFVARVVLQNRLTGVGPVWALGSKASPEKPVELWPLRTPFLTPLHTASERYPNGAWRVNPYQSSGLWGAMPARMGAAGAILPGEEVKRFVDPHPLVDWDGFSPLTAGAVQLDVYDAIELSRKSAMDNGLGVETIITIPGADADQVNRYKDQTESRHKGAPNAGKTMFMGVPTTGPADKPTALPLGGRTPKEMDYQAGWEQTVKFVLALFGVPDSVAGLKTAGNYAEAYAARQQFYDRQEDYLNRLAVWFDREFCDPWETYPDEFVLRIKPKPIQDKEFSEKQHARQCQVGTITLNESRAKDDLPPLPGGEDLLPVALAKMQQAAAPPEGEPGEEGMPGEEGEPDASADSGEDVPDEMAAAALEELGVPAEAVAKGQYDESKHRRDHGKFSSTGGASGGDSARHPSKHNPEVTYGSADDRDADDRASDKKIGQAKRGENRARADLGAAEQRHAQARAAADDLRRQLAEADRKVAEARAAAAKPAGAQPKGQRAAAVSQRAKSSPAVKAQLAKAHEWADAMAEKHADRVAKHLGIDRASAKHVIASTIKMLCEKALRGDGDSQTATHTGASGKKLTIGVKKKPGGGAQGGGTPSGPPRPANPAGKGSLAPRPEVGKAMSSLTGSDGGFLVPAGTGVRKRKRRRYREVVAKALRELGNTGG